MVECIDIMSASGWETTPKNRKCHEQTEMITLHCTFPSGDKLIKNKWIDTMHLRKWETTHKLKDYR